MSAMTADGLIEWCDPPPVEYRTGAQNIPWSAIAMLLRDRPGAWGRVIAPVANTNVAIRIRRGEARWFRPAGSFEATQRGEQLWIKYVGPNGENS